MGAFGYNAKLSANVISIVQTTVLRYRPAERQTNSIERNQKV